MYITFRFKIKKVSYFIGKLILHKN